MRSFPIRSAISSLALLAATAPPAFGQSAPADDAANAPEPDEIIVTAHALRDMSLSAGSVEIAGDELLRAASTQIGDTLARLPGVAATAFAPGASRPVLRGQSGDRVQVLIDGLGAIDASSVSADHGVTLDPMTIDHVDVLHGPAVLAYGGQAIGGAVYAYDKRIPRRMPDGPFDLTLMGGYSTVADGKNAAGSLDLPLASRLVAHVDAGWHDSGNMRVGGDVLSPQLKAEVLALAAGLREQGDSAGADDLAAAANRRGRVPDSATHGTTFGGGLAFIDDGGSLGVSVQRITNRYGVPARPGDGESGVSIAMRQTRADFRGELELGGGFLRSVQLRAAFADYAHDELDHGVAGTHFARTGIETRLELVQNAMGGWNGRSGLQYGWGNLDVTGAEAILPRNQDRRIGLFTVQSLKLGRIELDGALRHERVTIDSPAAAYRRTFPLHAWGAGIAWTPADALKLGVSYTHGERAPSAEELLTRGAHAATQSFEIGDRSFGKERSDGAEVYLHYDTPATRFSLAAYTTRFKGFITPLPTGGGEDGLPVFQYVQRPARFTGFEAQASQRLGEWGGNSLTLDASADMVRATLSGTGPAPRIPPLRIMGGVEYALPALTLRAEAEWNAAQTRVGAFENPTAAFTLVNLSATWKPKGEDGPLTLILSADNLLDANGRRAASFTRDFMPVAGRDVKLTAKLAL